MTAAGANLAWAAGLFEGEGSFYFRKRKDRVRGQTVAMLSMSDEDVVRRFRDAIGVGTVNGPHGPYARGKTPYWRWYVAGFEKTQYVVALLWPWLGPRRRRAAGSTLSAFAKIADPT